MKDFKTYDLAVSFYHLTQTLQIKGNLKDQLDRAASSIALNLAEGRGRSTRVDQRRFFHMAFGSLRESQAILDLTLSPSVEAVKLADVLAAHLYCLIKSYG